MVLTAVGQRECNGVDQLDNSFQVPLANINITLIVFYLSTTYLSTTYDIYDGPLLCSKESSLEILLSSKDTKW
jgi:hypothetical protein